MEVLTSKPKAHAHLPLQGDAERSWSEAQAAIGMLRSEVGPGKRSLRPIFIIETDFEVVDLYSGGKF